MSDEQRAKIEAGVREAHEFYHDQALPFISLAAFIHRLRSRANWSDAEINEVQRLAVRDLLAHRNRPAKTGSRLQSTESG